MAYLLGFILLLTQLVTYIVEYNAGFLLTIKRYKLTLLNLLFDINLLWLLSDNNPEMKSRKTITIQTVVALFFTLYLYK